MDEYQSIERNIGKVFGIINLVFEYKSHKVAPESVQYIDFAKEPLKVVSKPVAAEGEAVDDDAPKVVVFDPAQYKWTKTDKMASNLGQLFFKFNGANAVEEVL